MHKWYFRPGCNLYMMIIYAHGLHIISIIYAINLHIYAPEFDISESRLFALVLTH